MKITGAEILQGPEYPIVRVNSDAGVHGMAALNRPVGDHPRVRQLAEELLIGTDARAIAHHWTSLSAANDRHDRALSAEIAALDVALWDLRAKSMDEPLWRTLGALRPKVNVHARVPGTHRGRESLQRWCAEISAAGIRGVLLETSDDSAADAELLAMIRGHLGHRMDHAFMLDAQERWTPKDAIRALSEIERSVDLTWIESPAHRGDFLGLKRVGDAVRAAVCSGAQLTSAADFLPHLHRRSLDIVQIDLGRTGITAALQIADAAYGFELPVALTAVPGNVHAHLAAALPYCASIEWSMGALCPSAIRIENGWAVGDDTAGHGFELERVVAEGSRR